MFDHLSELYSIDIDWKLYNILIEPNQLELQEKHMIHTGLKNGSSTIGFIYTAYLEQLNEDIEVLAGQISIEDTKVALEDEVFYTAKIEGAKTTRKRTTEIHNGAPIDPSDKKSELMVRNGFRATKLLNLYGNKISDKILIDIWNVLVEDVCENESVRGPRYRIGDVEVGSYIPPEYTQIEPLMEQYINFYNSPTLENYPFIKAILLHYAFETIHPFCDGNGRLGRLLMNNYLISRGIDSAKAVSFSMLIDAKRSHYDVAFIDSENDHNDCTPFIKFMLETMKETYLRALTIQKKKEQSQKQSK